MWPWTKNFWHPSRWQGLFRWQGLIGQTQTKAKTNTTAQPKTKAWPKAQAVLLGDHFCSLGNGHAPPALPANLELVLLPSLAHCFTLKTIPSEAHAQAQNHPLSPQALAALATHWQQQLAPHWQGATAWQASTTAAPMVVLHNAPAHFLQAYAQVLPELLWHVRAQHHAQDHWLLCVHGHSAQVAWLVKGQVHSASCCPASLANSPQQALALHALRYELPANTLDQPVVHSVNGSAVCPLFLAQTTEADPQNPKR